MGEVTALRRSDVDAASGTVWVRTGVRSFGCDVYTHTVPADPSMQHRFDQQGGLTVRWSRLRHLRSSSSERISATKCDEVQLGTRDVRVFLLSPQRLSVLGRDVQLEVCWLAAKVHRKNTARLSAIHSAPPADCGNVVGRSRRSDRYLPTETDGPMVRPTEEPSDDFAIALGRVTHLVGRVEMLLDRLLTPVGEQPPRRGLSGDRLVKELRKVATAGGTLAEIVAGYEQQHEWRNHLVHGAHDYANGTLWTWREPIGAKGNAAFSFQFTLETLERLAESWQNLAEAVHAELHRRSTSAETD
jgi:hypothetical protein